MNLLRASSKGDLATVKKLVGEGANVNEADSSGRTPLIEAAWGGHLDVMKYLIDKKADVNAIDSAGFSALMRACEEGHVPIVSLLIKEGANVNAKGKVRGTTSLMLAAEKGHIKILEVLLANDAKVNDMDQHEETALARAFHSDQTKAVDFLESKGGRGKPERSSYSRGDRESRSSKGSLPQWNAGSYDSASEEEEKGASEEPSTDESYSEE
jgi:uncharacterized protein